MEPDETIEPLLADEDDDRTRQRAAGIGAVVGAVLGGRRGPLAAGVSAGVGGAVGYVVGDLLQRDGDVSETVTDSDESITIDEGDDGPVKIDIDGTETADETDDDTTEETAEQDDSEDSDEDN